MSCIVTDDLGWQASSEHCRMSCIVTDDLGWQASSEHCRMSCIVTDHPRVAGFLRTLQDVMYCD